MPGSDGAPEQGPVRLSGFVHRSFGSEYSPIRWLPCIKLWVTPDWYEAVATPVNCIVCVSFSGGAEGPL